MKRTIFVTGATGQQGTSLITALRPQKDDENDDYHILALTRDKTSPAAQHLSTEKHITLVEGDLNNRSSIEHIFQEAVARGDRIWGVFVVLEFPGLGQIADAEEAQGKVLSYSCIIWLRFSLTAGRRCSRISLWNTASPLSSTHPPFAPVPGMTISSDSRHGPRFSSNDMSRPLGRGVYLGCKLGTYIVYMEYEVANSLIPITQHRAPGVLYGEFLGNAWVSRHCRGTDRFRVRNTPGFSCEHLPDSQERRSY